MAHICYLDEVWVLDRAVRDGKKFDLRHWPTKGVYVQYQIGDCPKGFQEEVLTNTHGPCAESFN